MERGLAMTNIRVEWHVFRENNQFVGIASYEAPNEYDCFHSIPINSYIEAKKYARTVAHLLRVSLGLSPNDRQIEERMRTC